MRDWTSIAPAEQWLVLNFKKPVLLSGLRLHVGGGRGAGREPKDLHLLRGSTETGPWVNVKRTPLGDVAPSAGRTCDQLSPVAEDGLGDVGDNVKGVREINFDGGGASQYWKLRFLDTWVHGSSVTIVEPLEALAERTPSKCASRSRRRSLTTLFCEALNIPPEEQIVRRLARMHGIPLDAAEQICTAFQKFDIGGDGQLDYEDFGLAVNTLFNFTPQQARAHGMSPDVANQDMARLKDGQLKSMWREVDEDASGGIDMSEFMVWFHKMFQPDAGSTLTSFHSHRKADTVCERYYASLGQNRLKLPEQRTKNHQRILADAVDFVCDEDADLAPIFRAQEDSSKVPEDGVDHDDEAGSGKMGNASTVESDATSKPSRRMSTRSSVDDVQVVQGDQMVSTASEADVEQQLTMRRAARGNQRRASQIRTPHKSGAKAIEGDEAEVPNRPRLRSVADRSAVSDRPRRSIK